MLHRFLFPSLFLLPSFLVAAEPAAEKPAPLKVVWEVKDNLDRPESAYYDAESGVVFVSVIAGDGGKKDGIGWITKLDATGKVIKDKWVEGLNAPKGLRSTKGKLWVSDFDRVVSIDIAKGEIVDKIEIEGAKFLNDLAAGADGTVYVSDMIASKIYAIKDGKYSVFAEGEDIESPNGLLVDGDSLVVGGWGYCTDFNPKTPGRLFKLDLKTKKKTLITKEPTGNLDGVERDGSGGYIVTDWKAGKVLQISADGQVKLLMQHDKNGAADHAYLVDKRLLILPLMMDNKVTAFELPK